MKLILMLSCFWLFSLGTAAQYVPVDSARQLLRQASTPEDRFYALRSIDRYYYSRGIFDSSASLQTEMYTIAKTLNRDSILSDAERAVGVRYVFKTEYNLALGRLFKALEFKISEKRKQALFAIIGYLYSQTGNNQLAIAYLKKCDPNYLYTNLFLGIVYNNLAKPDSALLYLQKINYGDFNLEDAHTYSHLTSQLALAYELTGDTVLAAAYYKKNIEYSQKESLVYTYILSSTEYGNYLLNQGNFLQARTLGTEILSLSKKAGISSGIAIAAELLKKVYSHFSNKDSAFYYSEMQHAYKDSVSNQKLNSELQNLTFNQQLKEIEDEARLKQAEYQRKQNLQYVLMATGILTFVIFFLLLSRRVITNTRTIEFLSVVVLLIVFEFLNLFIHPLLERITDHSPMLMLLAVVSMAALLVPLHHRLEKWAKIKLVEKNKQVRLAAAKRTLQLLSEEEIKKNNS
jgi:hypothetical protein